MLNFLSSYGGWLVAVVLAIYFVLFLMTRAFRWARRRRAELAYAQHCIGGITWPGSAGVRHSFGHVVSAPPPPRSARSELRGAPR